MPVAFDENGYVMGPIDEGPLPEPGRYEFVYEFSVEGEVFTFIPVHGGVLRPRWFNLGTFRASGDAGYARNDDCGYRSGGRQFPVNHNSTLTPSLLE